MFVTSNVQLYIMFLHISCCLETFHKPFNSDVYAPVTARLMLEGKQVSRGNRGMKLMLEALYRLYQEAFWAWVQQRDQTDLS